MKRHKGNRSTSKELMDVRSENIALNDIILGLGSGRYKVSSQSESDLYYDVTVMDNSWKCTCPYFVHRNYSCKHIGAVQSIVENVREDQRSTVKIDDPGVMCTKCGHCDCKYRETRKKKNGVAVRYVCQTCGKKFTHSLGFVGRRCDEDIVTDVLQDVAMSKSLTQAAQGLAKRNVFPDPSTVWRQTKQYGSLLKALSNLVASQAGYEWSVDELYYKSLGREMWLFGVLDINSRFVLNSDVSPSKFGYDATNLFAGAINLAKKIPDVVTTDALAAFAKGLNSALPGGKRSRMIYRKDAGIRRRHVNNIYERFNGTLKDRLKCVRGFRSALPALHVLYLAYYDLFWPHCGINKKTPAEAMGVVVGVNRWLTAIRYAALFCT